MTNLPNSGQSNSMDNTSVTRNEFRTGMNGLLQYLAEALGNQSSYTTQAVSPTAVKLNGTPTAPTPAASDNSTKVATTAFVKTAVSGGAVTPGNGAINVNGGDGITASGSNATANQSSGTTRTLSVKAKADGGIIVDSNGVSVDWSKNPGGSGGNGEVFAFGHTNESNGSHGAVTTGCTLNLRDGQFPLWRVTFSTAQPNTNYAAVATVGRIQSSDSNIKIFEYQKTYVGLDNRYMEYTFSWVCVAA